MVSFACKQIDFKDLLMCSFDLNKTEYDLFLFLLDVDDSLCVRSIAELMYKDRTTIQKAIKKLITMELVEKFQVNSPSGGYSFVYSLKNKKYLRSIMLDIVNSWHKKVVDTINNW